MNIINACAKYTGYEENIKAFRFEIPSTGQNPTPAPVFVVKNYTARKSGLNPDTFEKGTNVLITGRLGNRKLREGEEEDGRMYISPTQELQIAHPDCKLNHVQLSGQVCWIQDELKITGKGNSVLNCYMFCSGGKEALLNRDYNDDVSFKVEVWGDEAQRWFTKVKVGQAIALGGTLKFDCWTAKDGSKKGGYKVGVKNTQHDFYYPLKEVFAGEDIKKGEEVIIETNKESKRKEVFMKNKAKDNTPQVFDSPHQQAMSTPPVKPQKDVEDGIPF